MRLKREPSAFDVAVVGAGAAGQMAAIAAAEEGRRVLLLEQMDRPGLKVLASGGGRCNLTNLAGRAAFVAAFGREGRFIGPALDLLGPADLRLFMDRLGVPTAAPDGFHVYPASRRAADVQAALGRRIGQLGVTLRVGCAVRGLWLDGGRLAGVETASAGRIAAGRVVLACGGKSWPDLGGTGGGYALARQAGHTIVEPVPALVPLVVRERWPGRLAGVSLSGARVRIALARQSKAGATGDVLFTHRGLSGPAVLDLSGTVAELLARGKPVPLYVEPVPGVDESGWVNQLEAWRGARGRSGVANLLGERLPASLARELCRMAGLEDGATAAHLAAGRRDALAHMLGAIELAVTATEGFEAAFVTRGGVRLREVDPATLAGRRLPGLYLAGELLDLDGPSGGFNLQWAFASGRLAGKSAAASAPPHLP